MDAKHDSSPCLRVLAVDDESETLRALARWLRRHDVSLASGPEIAIELLSARPFDVIVSDNAMPGGSGEDVLRFAADRQPATCRVMHSGSVPRRLEALRQAGIIEHFLHKPAFAAVASLVDLVGAERYGARDRYAVGMYQIWSSEGRGTSRGPSFSHLGDALRYVETRRSEASFAIRKPDGSWYRRRDGASSFPRRAPR